MQGHFQSSGSNMGMVLDQSFWNAFRRCTYEFCHIDDYNWDWTLEHLHRECFAQPLKILKPEAPRVYHVGDCGTHSKAHKTGCRKGRLKGGSLENVQNLIKRRNSSLFPAHMKFSPTPLSAMSPLPGKSTLAGRYLNCLFI